MLSHKLAYEQDASLATLESPNEQVDRKSALLTCSGCKLENNKINRTIRSATDAWAHYSFEAI